MAAQAQVSHLPGRSKLDRDSRALKPWRALLARPDEDVWADVIC